MREDRHLGTERAKQDDVLRRVGEVVVAARHVRDVHVDVVDDDGGVIRRIAVGADEHEVVDQLAFELHVAANEIVELDRTRLHFAADDVGRVSRLRIALFRAHAATAGVAIGVATLFRRGAIRFQLFDRAVAAVGFAAGHQLLGALAIDRQPVALVNRTFVPIDAQPVQRADDLLGVMLPGALHVRVLDAQQHPPAEPPRMQQIEDRRTRAADMQETGGRRSEPQLHRTGHRGRRIPK